MQFFELYREVSSTIPKLSDFLAKRYVNRARRDIYESRFWSFLRQFGYITVPAGVSTGTFTLVNGSATATADATATTNLTGLTNPPITSRQIRFGGGPLYNIGNPANPAGIVGSSVFLDRPYGEASITGIAYQCYQCYYGPPYEFTGSNPVTDFLRYIDVMDPIQPWRLTLNLSREWLDMRDQQRTNIGSPSQILANFASDTTANALPLYEMWPHPTQQRTLLCIYQKRGVDLVNDSDTVPVAIPENCIISRALWYGYTWAMANVGVHPELRMTGSLWPRLRQEVYGQYKEELFKAQKQDVETMITHNITTNMGWPGWASSFIQQMNLQGGVTSPPVAP